MNVRMPFSQPNISMTKHSTSARLEQMEEGDTELCDEAKANMKI